MLPSAPELLERRQREVFQALGVQLSCDVMPEAILRGSPCRFFPLPAVERQVDLQHAIKFYEDHCDRETGTLAFRGRNVCRVLDR